MPRACNRLFVAVVGALAIAALSAAPASAGKTPNPCKLLKKSEVERVTKADVDGPSRNTSLCAWDLDGGLGDGGGKVTVELDVGDGAADNYEGFATGQEEIDGVGDRAFYSSVLGFNVLQDDTYLRVQETFGIDNEPSERKVRRQVTRLTKLALERV